MRLYHDTSFRYCVSCGGTEPACQAAQERGLIACCPDCDHGVPVVPVPWCETHDSPEEHDGICQYGWHGGLKEKEEPCRLQDPPKVWRDDG